MASKYRVRRGSLLQRAATAVIGGPLTCNSKTYAIRRPEGALYLVSERQLTARPQQAVGGKKWKKMFIVFFF